jgi:hypothetical protein
MDHAANLPLAAIDNDMVSSSRRDCVKVANDINFRLAAYKAGLGEVFASDFDSGFMCDAIPGASATRAFLRL